MLGSRRNRWVALLAATVLLSLCGCGGARSVSSAGTASTPVVVDVFREDVKDLAPADVLQVPYILWGGDVATYHANGGETTTAGSLFDKLGLKLRLVRGDDFGQQVKDYKE